MMSSKPAGAQAVEADANVSRNSRFVGATATIAAAGALACGVCCVLPFALPAAILGLTGGVIGWFAGVQPWLTAASVIAVVVGWAWVSVQSVRARRRPAYSTLATMSVATILMIAAWEWPHIEPWALGLIAH
jgi:hypothetical protein